jgi:fucose permease
VTAARPTSKQAASTMGVVATAYLIFILLGMPDGMLGVAWPSMQTTFGVALGQMGVVLLATTVGFLITSFSVGRLIRRLGIANLLIISTVVRGASLVAMGFAPTWYAFVAAAFCFGVGSGAIDAGMNTYFAMNLSPRLMNWLHASFGLGATFGPLLMTALLTNGLTWRWGYLLVGVLQASVAIIIFIRADDWQLRSSADSAPTQASIAHRSYRATLSRPIVWVNIFVFFFYTGIEVTAGNWSFTLFTQGRGISVEQAGFWVGLYWASFTLGRLLFGFVADRVNVTNAIRLMIVVAIFATGLIWWNPSNWVSFAGLAILGFALAPVFPLLVSSTPSRLGVADATNAIGFQVGAASAGIAILPGLAGVLAERTTVEIIAPFMVVTTVILFVLYEIAVRRAGEPASAQA